MAGTHNAKTGWQRAMKDVFSYNDFSAVSQKYSTKAMDEYVILGNDALVACKVPSFVSDFVDVVGWVDGNQVENTLGATGRYGRILIDGLL